jgi:hypothetical protein
MVAFSSLLFVAEHVMFVKSIGKFGDRVALTSPLYQSDDCPYANHLLFHFYIHQKDKAISSLEVIALSEHGIPIGKLYDSRRSWISYNDWNEESIVLPTVGSFYLMFVAVLGKPFVTDLMLDDVDVVCMWPMMEPPGMWARVQHLIEPIKPTE